ncbi:tyrosine-type recombinase/integrase [Polynucleobacter sp. P1-05-14]|uniref:tyrosine-type recombinase/integrase n=1 Tax=Polynucleobacter sp. P1-05-14 TaxID=1819732 RepID=UPI001C0B7724|nr:tyrosine-type recombinase/integrase [Polynucleobacter sp. P1-05-14]MBU3548408.1 tyrosine-type recombinase/integrase [Polynucleobacter sp. P1-05-14]
MLKETELLTLFFQSTSTPEKSSQLKYLENLATGKLVHMRDGNITLYKRERSNQWQMRFRLFDKKWHRVSTGYEDLEYAKKKAGDIYDRARFMEELGLPPLNKRFDSAAEAAKVELQGDLDNGVGKKIYVDYISVIDNYLTPFFGKKHLTSINHQDIAEYEVWRAEKMKRKLMRSTMMTHFSAYNRVFDLAIKRGWLSDKHPVPRLGTKGEKSTPRPAFTRKEIDYLLHFLKTWSQGGKTEEAHLGRLLLRDYIEILMATGMRHGTEAFNIQWRHLEWHTDKGVRYLRIWVSGKTGPRWLIARHEAIPVIERLKNRFSEWDHLTLDQLLEEKREEFLWRHPNGERPYDFVSSFKWLMKDSGLLLSTTGAKRTMYSFRHTYATFSLVEWGMDIHTLAKQMGTSVQMLERFYSKLTATLAAEKLAG